MSEQMRCPFCESAIPREALFCSRCGGKLPRAPAAATAAGIAPRASTPPAAAVRASVSPATASLAAGGAPSSGAPSTTMPSATTGMSVSQIQRPGRGLVIPLVVVGAAICIAGGWALGHYRQDDAGPIAAVPAPAVVELGQPRVAVGADLPDPSQLLDPVSPAAVRTDPTRPRAGEVPGRGGRAPTKGGAAPAPGGGTPPAGAGQAAPPDHAPPAGGGEPAPGGGATPPDPTPPPPDPTPPPDPPGELGGEGQLDTRAVIFVVRHYLPQVRACYERQLRNEPGLRGQITMRFTVGAGGRIVSTDVVVNSTSSAPLAACVAANMRTWRFPEPEGGPVAFEYPFRFGRQDALPELPGATQDP